MTDNQNTDNNLLSIVVDEDEQIHIQLPNVDISTFIRWMGVAIHQITYTQGLPITELMYAITHAAIEVSNLDQGEDDIPDEDYVEGEVL